MLCGSVELQVSHNREGFGKKVRDYYSISEILTKKSYDRFPICDEDDAEYVQELAISRLEMALKGLPTEYVENIYYDKTSFIRYSDIVSLYNFVPIFENSKHMYWIGEDLENQSINVVTEYYAFRGKYLIVDVKIPERDISIEFRLRAFMFPKQTSEDIPEPEWRAGGIIIRTPTIVHGYFHQCRWRLNH